MCAKMWTDVGRDREQERQRKMRDKRSEQPDKDSDQMMRRAGFWMVLMLGAAAVCILMSISLPSLPLSAATLFGF